MATAKAAKAAQMEQTAKRLDFLAGNARILRDPALWKTYAEAVHIAELLGFTVVQEGGHHKVTLC